MTTIHAAELPPSFIRIDKEGTWYYKGSEMYRKDILKLFFQGLRKDKSGRYYLDLENDRASLEVEDTAFVIRAVYRFGSCDDGDERISLLLSDETLEPLDCGTLRIGEDNVLYCTVKAGAHEARFLRASYYQISDYFDYDEATGNFYLPLNGARHLITTKSGSEPGT